MKSEFQKSLRAPVNQRGFALDDAALGRTATGSNHTWGSTPSSPLVLMLVVLLLVRALV